MGVPGLAFETWDPPRKCRHFDPPNTLAVDERIRVLYKCPAAYRRSAMAYILSLDQGTTSSRAILFGHDGNIVAHASASSRRFTRRADGSSMTPSTFSPRK